MCECGNSYSHTNECLRKRHPRVAFSYLKKQNSYCFYVWSRIMLLKQYYFVFLKNLKLRKESVLLKVCCGAGDGSHSHRHLFWR